MFLEGKQYTELETLYDKIEETSSELLTILSKHEDELDAMERMEGTLEYELKDTICYNLRGTLESLRDALGTLDEALHLD